MSGLHRVFQKENYGPKDFFFFFFLSLPFCCGLWPLPEPYG